MTKIICLDSNNFSLGIKIKQKSFFLPDLTKTLKKKKKEEEKKGATSFYFKIKIGYILFLCVILHCYTLRTHITSQ